MPTEKVSMRKIKEVLKLNHSGVGNREIARRLNISAGSVSNYLTRAKAAGLIWPLEDEWSDDKMYSILFPADNKKTTPPFPDFAKVHQELKRKGVTLMLLWYEYQQQTPGGYSYSRYCELYQAFIGKCSPSMRLTHRAGEKLFVDYSGLTVSWIDKATGESHKAQIFVAVLGASNYTFVEATASQSVLSWVQSHVHAFEFFAGVPVCLVPDNLRSGVTKAHLYNPDINRTYQDMADHYDVAVVPTRVRTPKDKPKVEVGVQGIQRWILAPLRDVIFFSVQEINDAIKPLLTAYNERAIYELEGSRRSQYMEVDKPTLKALPTTRYVYAEWKKAHCGGDYHVAINKHYYSIPYQYISESIDVRITSTTDPGYSEMIEWTKKVSESSHYVYGARRMRKALNALGYPVGIKKTKRLMREAGVFVRYRKKYKVTTNSKHSKPLFENVLSRQFKVDCPDKAYVSDITYIHTQEGWLYLAVVIDLFSRKVVGWSMSSRMKASLVCDALKMALWQRKPRPGLVVHSDRGSQYASHDYRKLLKLYGCRGSMSRKGNCWDNAVAESFFGSLKQERVQWKHYLTRYEAQQDVLNYMAVFYNSYRLHSYLGYQNPNQFEVMWWELKKVA